MASNIGENGNLNGSGQAGPMFSSCAAQANPPAQKSIGQKDEISRIIDLAKKFLQRPDDVQFQWVGKQSAEYKNARDIQRFNDGSIKVLFTGGSFKTILEHRLRSFSEAEEELEKDDKGLSHVAAPSAASAASAASPAVITQPDAPPPPYSLYDEDAGNPNAVVAQSPAIVVTPNVVSELPPPSYSVAFPQPASVEGDAFDLLNAQAKANSAASSAAAASVSPNVKAQVIVVPEPPESEKIVKGSKMYVLYTAFGKALAGQLPVQKQVNEALDNLLRAYNEANENKIPDAFRKLSPGLFPLFKQVLKEVETNYFSAAWACDNSMAEAEPAEYMLGAEPADDYMVGAGPNDRRRMMWGNESVMGVGRVVHEYEDIDGEKYSGYRREPFNKPWFPANIANKGALLSIRASFYVEKSGIQEAHFLTALEELRKALEVNANKLVQKPRVYTAASKDYLAYKKSIPVFISGLKSSFKDGLAAKNLPFEQALKELDGVLKLQFNDDYPGAESDSKQNASVLYPEAASRIAIPGLDPQFIGTTRSKVYYDFAKQLIDSKKFDQSQIDAILTTFSSFFPSGNWWVILPKFADVSSIEIKPFLTSALVNMGVIKNDQGEIYSSNSWKATLPPKKGTEADKKEKAVAVNASAASSSASASAAQPVGTLSIPPGLKLRYLRDKNQATLQLVYDNFGKQLLKSKIYNQDEINLIMHITDRLMADAPGQWSENLRRVLAAFAEREQKFFGEALKESGVAEYAIAAQADQKEKAVAVNASAASASAAAANAASAAQPAQKLTVPAALKIENYYGNGNDKYNKFKLVQIYKNFGKQLIDSKRYSQYEINAFMLSLDFLLSDAPGNWNECVRKFFNFYAYNSQLDLRNYFGEAMKSAGFEEEYKKAATKWNNQW